jgi:hypothetical protein
MQERLAVRHMRQQRSELKQGTVGIPIGTVIHKGVKAWIGDDVEILAGALELVHAKAAVDDEREGRAELGAFIRTTLRTVWQGVSEEQKPRASAEDSR